MTLSNRSDRSLTLDVVRAVAILAVIGVHSFQHAVLLVPGVVAESSRLFVGFSYLRYGVELFFLLSGWLIFSIYRSRDDALSGYWKRRIARIWPLWICFTALSFLAAYFPTKWFGETAAPTSSSLIGYVAGFLAVSLFLGWTSFTLWNVPSGGWSIQVEMGHYALFALLYRRKASVLLGSILVGYATYFVADQFSQHLESGSTGQIVCDAWIRLGLYGTWPFFIVGGLAYLARQESNFSLRRTLMVVRKRPALVLMSLAILIVAKWIPLPLGTTYEAASAVIVLLAVAWLVMQVVKLHRSLASIGRYSYFMYFAHFWILEVLLVALLPHSLQFQDHGSVGLLASFVAFFAISVFVSWLLALASWRWFESFWIRLAAR